MSKVGQFIVLLIAATSAAATLVVPGLANPQPQAETDTFIWPWFFPHDPEILRCWSSLLSIEGCKNEIIMAFITLQVNLGPACCKAINELSENCVPKIFSCIPFNPFLPPLIKDYCASIGGIPSPLTPVHAAPPPPTAEAVPPPPSSPAESVPPPPSSPAEAVPPSSDEQLAPTPTADLAPNAPDQGELSPPPSDPGISPSPTFDQEALNVADDGTTFDLGAPNASDQGIPPQADPR